MPFTPQIRRRRKPNRRGALLLVCLSLLVLFAVIGTTFVLVSGQYRRAARSEVRTERYADDPGHSNPRKLLDEAFMQLARGTTNQTSSLQYHDLLGDMYGHQVLQGQIATVTPVTVLPLGSPPPGQILELNVQATRLSPAAGYYNGCLLTMLDGPAKGSTARIVGYRPGGGTTQGFFRVQTFAEGNIPLAGNRLIVNARPFSGTGFGYNPGPPDSSDPNPGQLTLMDADGHSLTLAPHFKYSTHDGTINPIWGGAHEDYDAPDVQNMALAHIEPGRGIAPSFHRPDLVSYWISEAAKVDPTITDWGTLLNADADLARHIVLRPLPSDHPNFTGSNLSFNPATGPWDVDNDGDGVPDSVWIDLGFPAQTSADGRQFKPLFAFLCLDLDGRLNVNAHGSLAEVYDLDTSTTPATSILKQPVTGYFAGAAANATAWQMTQMPRGQGYGPAEVSLRNLWDNSDSAAWQKYAQLLGGNANWEGRYGERPNLAAALPVYDSTAPHFGPHPGITFDGSPATDDILSALKQFEFYGALSGSGLNAFSSPSDLWGRRWLGLDLRGVPVWARYNPALEAVEVFDDPYELDLSHKNIRNAAATGTVDNPFSVYELEALLRPYDIDAATLPPRLRQLLLTGGSTQQVQRHLATTDSFDAPVAAMQVPVNVTTAAYSASGLPRHEATLIDFYRFRLSDAGVPAGQLNAQLAILLPFDLVSGLQMDLNRPFGNGLDDNNNGAVDEPGETDTSGNPTVMWNNPAVPFFPVWNSGTEPNNDFATRQAYARHLYALVMFLKGPGQEIDFDGDPNNNTPEETAYGLAQWAVNVVDFRDRDAIMTPFEFDIYMYDNNGWNVDGDISPASTDNAAAHRGLVWGCERPELLITETLAFHDRRTEDLETPNRKTTFDSDPGTPPDPEGETDAQNDFDQRLRPRSGVFFELYNPWSVNEAPPAELYRDNSNNPAPGVALDRISDPSNPGTAAPVWRLAVMKGNGLTRDPDDPDPSRRPAAADFDRAIYFADPANVTDIADKYHTDLAVAPVRPGHYAVIGSSGATEAQAGQDYITPIGRNITDAEGTYAQTRQIVLTPSADPTVSNATVVNNGGSEPAAADIKRAVGIAINLPRSLSLTEPYTGYPNAGPGGETWDPTAAGNQGAYNPPIDEPLDQNSTVQTDATLRDLLVKNATHLGFRVVHLQRLANPLLPWDANTNPYITIDTMSVDLTTFNSESGGVNDPQAGGTNDAGIATLERGDPDNGMGSVDPQHNIWRRQPIVRTQAVTSAGDGTHNYGFRLNHTLGYLNKSYGTAYDSTSAPDPFYVGDPQRPFPWLTWNNRPYVGPHELMLVPPHRSSQLARRMTLPTATPNEEYSNTNPPLYGHLLNFFATDNAGNGPALYRLFDYVRVPSPFVGTETWLNPTTFSTTDPGTEGLHPPFNRISKYRDPGKVNINTIADARVWQGIVNTHDGLGLPSFAEVQASRNGNGASPLFFSNPFRSAAGAQYQLPNADASAPLAGGTWGSGGLRETDVTLQRRGTSGTAPLFGVNFDSSTDPTKAWHDSHRNPYFRYSELNRLGNLVTTRSNVYAVWLTVGYFEVEAGTIDDVHPDGYRLGQELGADTGEITRHRGFYIFDRTLPVGYLPGQNLNVEKAILLKRFIE